MNQNWLFKYKLYHIPFWFLYNYLLWVVAIGNPLTAAHDILFTPFAIKFSFYVIFPAIAVYFNLYFLIPRYLEKSRFTAYIAYLLITILIAAILVIPGYYVTAAVSGKTVAQLYGKEGASCIYGFLGTAIPATIACMTLAMSIKLTKNWIRTQRRQQLLEKEKLETELKFLKNQFNPHFLFNSINSIFFLIHKNPDKASASLAKFSELLRYQLYECNDHQIPLEKEITYLENFIELEKLRQNKNFKMSLQIDRKDREDLGIAPFILMTFVENAFKHVSKDTDKSNWINIKIEVTGQQLVLIISNSTSPDAVNEVIRYSGIGLNNVRRRLDLIYPGLYELDISNNLHRFEVRLRLELSELTAPAEHGAPAGHDAPVEQWAPVEGAAGEERAVPAEFVAPAAMEKIKSMETF
jgi:two-component system LytT family sensor kinase